MAIETNFVKYDPITIAGVSITDSCKASFEPPYNIIDVKMTLKIESVSYFEVRVTPIDEKYGVGIGTLAHAQTNLSLSSPYKFCIDINETTFNKGDGDYRISFYAKNAVDGKWDESFLLFTIKDEQLTVKQAVLNAQGQVVSYIDIPLAVGNYQDIPAN